MNPWEKYQAEPSEGPWSAYAQGVDVAAPAPPQASLADKIVGSWGGRTALGLLSPLIAGAQLFGGEETRAKIAELEAMKRRGMAAEGKSGLDVYGMVGSLLPAGAIAKGVSAALPAASSLMGRLSTGALQGGVAALATPSAGVSHEEFASEKAKQVGIGAGAGVAGAGIGEVTDMVTNKARQKVADALASASQNATRDATIKQSIERGYVIPPSMTSNPSAMNTALESFGGKAALGQEAARRNQTVTNALVRKELGIPPNQALTDDLLETMRTTAAQPYREIAAMSPTAKAALEGLQESRQQYNLALNEFAKNGSRQAYRDAQGLKQTMDTLEVQLQQEANQAGRPDLMKALSEARQKIAKLHDVSRALNESTGNVSAPMLGRALDKNSPLSGELEAIGKFRNAFPQLAREAESVPTPGVSHVNALTSLALGAGGAAAGGPAGILAGGVPLLRGPARNLILSRLYQNQLAQPSYGGATSNAVAGIPEGSLHPYLAALLSRTISQPQPGGP